MLVAADLFAASFSDNSVSTKTKNMKEKVEKLRGVVKDMNLTARRALGEEKAEGGFFGLGAKQPSANELANTMRKLYVEGKFSLHDYTVIFILISYSHFLKGVILGMNTYSLQMIPFQFN